MDAVQADIFDARLLAPGVFDFLYTDTQDIGTVNFNNVHFEGEHKLQMFGSGGDDELRLLYDTVQFGSSALEILVDGNVGNDRLDVALHSVNDVPITLNGAAGDDTLALSLQEVERSSAALAGGDGDDALLIEDTRGDRPINQKEYSVTGGTGDDELISRFSFSPQQDFSVVRLQQGRVSLDADSNTGTGWMAERLFAGSLNWLDFDRNVGP